MPQPNVYQPLYDPILTSISIANMQSDTMFGALSAAPIVPVQSITGLYYTWPTNNIIRQGTMQPIGPDGRYPEVGFTHSTDNYQIPVVGERKGFSEAELAAAVGAGITNLEGVATDVLTLRAKLTMENAFASTLLKPASSPWSTNYTGVASGTPSASEFLRWDVPTSNPSLDIKNAINVATIRSGGQKPNKLIVAQDVFTALTENASINAKIMTTPGSGTVTKKVLPETLAAHFGLDEVIVVGAVQNTAKEGAADSNAFIGAGNALLAYFPDSPGIMTPSAAYMFAWSGFVPGQSMTLGGRTVGAVPFRIRQHPDPHVGAGGSRVFYGEAAFLYKVINPTMGVLFSGAIS